MHCWTCLVPHPTSYPFSSHPYYTQVVPHSIYLYGQRQPVLSHQGMHDVVCVDLCTVHECITPVQLLQLVAHPSARVKHVYIDDDLMEECFINALCSCTTLRTLEVSCYDIDENPVDLLTSVDERGAVTSLKLDVGADGEPLPLLEYMPKWLLAESSNLKRVRLKMSTSDRPPSYTPALTAVVHAVAECARCPRVKLSVQHVTQEGLDTMNALAEDLGVGHLVSCTVRV